MRKPRQKASGACYHVTSNFHPALLAQIKGFVKKQFIACVRVAKRKFHFKVKNICVMDTHIHLLIQPEEGEDISIIMKFIKQKFSQWFNRVFCSSGPVWRERFFSRIVQDLEDLLGLFIYIGNNPVKAGLACSPQEYPFYEAWDLSLNL